MDLLRVPDAAKLLQVHPHTVRRWEREGKIKCFRTPGGIRLFSIDEINRVRVSMGLPLYAEPVALPSQVKPKPKRKKSPKEK